MRSRAEMQFITGYAGRAIIGAFILAIVLFIVGWIAESVHARDAGIPVLQWFDTGIVEKVSNQPYGAGE
jgi:hypothetical protein